MTRLNSQTSFKEQIYRFEIDVGKTEYPLESTFTQIRQLKQR
jgi:hypothetical protein